MTSKELLKMQLDDAGSQLTRLFEGMSDEELDFKAAPHMLSGRDTLGHLTECYIATQKSMAGEEHAWGSYESPDKSAAGMIGTFQAERVKATEAVLSGDSEKGAKTATDFMILHDAYHVGQMCTNRIGFNSEWNAYSIYGM